MTAAMRRPVVMSGRGVLTDELSLSGGGGGGGGGMVPLSTSMEFFLDVPLREAVGYPFRFRG